MVKHLEKLFTGGADRKIQALERASVFRRKGNKLISNMVECAPEVVGSISHNGRKRVVNIPGASEIPNALAGLEVVLGIDFIGLTQKTMPAALNITDVMFGPFNLY
jgi:hypothetical protein